MSRSTRLSVLDKHCPWALKLHDDGVPRGGEIRYGVGKAAHAVLEAFTRDRPGTEVATGDLARAVAEALISKGSTFDGMPEPPMTPGEAAEGRDLAMGYYYAYGLPPEGTAELGLGMDEQGKPAPYATAYVKAAIDEVWFDDAGDEDCQFPICVVRDYKSSWQAGETELATLQRKIQAVLAWRHYAERSAAIRMEVVNLRTLARYENTIYLDEEGERFLQDWEKDILSACRALAVVEANPVPAPGAGCSACPWAYRCQHCMAMAVVPEPEDPRSVAYAYAAAQARRDVLVVMAKRLAEEGDIPIHDGVVGYRGQREMRPRPGAGAAVLDYWLEATGAELGDARPAMESLLNTLKLGSGSINALGKVLFPGRGAGKVSDFKEQRSLLEETCLEPVTVPVFGARRCPSEGEKENLE